MYSNGYGRNSIGLIFFFQMESHVWTDAHVTQPLEKPWSDALTFLVSISFIFYIFICIPSDVCVLTGLGTPRFETTSIRHYRWVDGLLLLNNKIKKVIVIRIYYEC